VRFDSIAEWLGWQQNLNPRGIDLGLERCLPLARSLGLQPLPFPLISVAGTNGKGSCVAMLEAALSAAGYRVGAYTSPHLVSFNETVRVGGEAVGDRTLLQAFEAVADARGEVMLTWFEFRTLAAARILRDADLDLAILEVGLGGRLDAVNMFDADLALVTSIGVDHVDWLGESRDQIGREKAGICRKGRPVVCAEPEPPKGFLDAVTRAGALLYRVGIDYEFERREKDWRWLGPEAKSLTLPEPGIAGDCQIGNAAAALMALHLIEQRFPVDLSAMREGLERCRLCGRQQVVLETPQLWLDVAHNGQAAEALAASLRQRPCRGKTRAVFAIYADKDIAAVAGAVKDCIQHWYLAGLAPPRGAPAVQTANALEAVDISTGVSIHPDPRAALAAAKKHSAPNDRIVVFGSFETVRNVLELESSQT
jgi:dihydrofolate synthase/folylpolyglutamate synthase